MIIIGKTNLIFGVPIEQKPFVLPVWIKADKIRLRFRPREFATAFVKHANVLRRYAMIDEGYYFTIDGEIVSGANESLKI